MGVVGRKRSKIVSKPEEPRHQKITSGGAIFNRNGKLFRPFMSNKKIKKRKKVPREKTAQQTKLGARNAKGAHATIKNAIIMTRRLNNAMRKIR